MSSNDVGDLILHLATSNRSFLDFSSKLMPEEKYLLYTGLQRNNFKELNDLIKHRLNNSPNQTARNALGMFLCLMRLSISQNQIADLFGTNQVVISEAINTVAKLLDEELVLFYLRFKPTHLTRDEAIATHGSQFYNKIYDQRDDTLKITTDGSYL